VLGRAFVLVPIQGIAALFLKTAALFLKTAALFLKTMEDVSAIGSRTYQRGGLNGPPLCVIPLS